MRLATSFGIFSDRYVLCLGALACSMVQLHCGDSTTSDGQNTVGDDTGIDVSTGDTASMTDSAESSMDTDTTSMMDAVADSTLDMDLNIDTAADDISIDDSNGNDDTSISTNDSGSDVQEDSSAACTNNTDCSDVTSELICMNMACVDCVRDSFDQMAANDSQETATDLMGNLMPDEDLNTCMGSDFYTFTADLNQTITATAAYDATNGIIDLLLFSPTGSRFAGVTGVDNGLDTDTAIAPITDATEVGSWTLQVSGSLPVGVVNDYRLVITIE
ncbi:MAG: hypothetical protein AAFX99_27350 [Myxococcota bacterium]